MCIKQASGAMILGVFLSCVLGWIPGAKAIEGVTLSREGAGIELRWPGVRTAPDGTTDRPWFEIQYSRDLKRWTPTGQRLRSSGGEELQYSLTPDAPQGFYRVLADRTAALAGTGEGGAEVFGYGAAFEAALEKIGQISPQAFAERYASGADYLPGLTWDPTTARFWDQFDADPVVVNVGKMPGTVGYRSSDYRLKSQEREAFRRNGFVVSERLGALGGGTISLGTSMGSVYYQLWYNDLPVFVSTDSVLHAWHRTYQMMLAELEEFLLAPSLEELLRAMLQKLPEMDLAVGNGVLRESVRDADYYLHVALRLLTLGNPSSVLGQDSRVAETLSDISKLEFKQVPDFMGHCRTVDYSQFRVRGHYTQSQVLSAYFQAMMWLGRIDLPVAGGPFERCPGDLRMASPRELGTAIVLNQLLRDSGGAAIWGRMERVLSAFVGWSDSLTFPQLEGVLAGAGVRSVADVTGLDVLQRLQDAIVKGDLGIQNIRSDAFYTPLSDGVPVQLPRSYLLFGQRFVPDSWVLSQTVYDAIQWKEGDVTHDVMRRVPSALDVAFAVFGNDQVVPMLVDRILRSPDLPRRTHADSFRDGFPYQHNLAAARTVIDGQRPDVWDTSIAMGWLGALRELSAPTTAAAYPESMRTRAWGMKTLSTQLASWTQYRHDTLLYVKQSYTSIPLCFYPAGFVEPRPEFWRRLQRLASNAADALRGLEYPEGIAKLPAPVGIPFPLFQSNQVAHLDRFASTVGMLAGMAAKELAQMPFSQEEELFVRNLMQSVGWDPVGSGATPRYSGWYPALFYRPIRFTDLATFTGVQGIPVNRDAYYHETYGCAAPDRVVADIHTDLPATQVGDPGSVLHQGVGGIGLLLIAIDNGPDRMVYAGPVLSHYEFEVLGEPFRLTDSEWESLNSPWMPPPTGDRVVEGLAPPEWTREYWIPAPN